MDGGRIAVAIDQGGLTCDISAYTCAKSADVDEEDEDVGNGPPRQADPTRSAADREILTGPEVCRVRP